jgi:hypothetical protein
VAKLQQAPEKQKQEVLKTETMVEKLAKMKAMTPIEIRNALLKNVPALAKIKTANRGRGGGGISGKKLEELREELLSGSEGSRKFMDGVAERLEQQSTRLDSTTPADAAAIRNMKEKEIIEKYGPDLAAYLRDVRDAESDAAASAALNKAKAKVRKEYDKRAAKLRKASKRLAEISAQLRVEGIEKDKKKKEKLLRELNKLLMTIQQEQ